MSPVRIELRTSRFAAKNHKRSARTVQKWVFSHNTTVYVSQLVRYARACCNYEDFVDRVKLLTSKLLSQGYRMAKLVSTLKTFYLRHHDLVDPYSVAASKLVTDHMPTANK